MTLFQIILAALLVLWVAAAVVLILNPVARRAVHLRMGKAMVYLLLKWQEYRKKRAARPKRKSHFHAGEALIFLAVGGLVASPFIFGAAKLSELHVPHVPGWVWAVLGASLLVLTLIIILAMNWFARSRRPKASAAPKAAAAASASAHSHGHGGHGGHASGGWGIGTFAKLAIGICVFLGILTVGLGMLRGQVLHVWRSYAQIPAAASAPAPVSVIPAAAVYVPPEKEVPLPGTQRVMVPSVTSTTFSDAVPVVANATICRPNPAARGYDIEYHDGRYPLPDTDKTHWKRYPEYGDPYGNAERYRSTNEESYTINVCYTRSGDCTPECPDPA